MRQVNKPVEQGSIGLCIPEQAALEFAESNPGRIPLLGGEVTHALPGVQSSLLGKWTKHLPEQIDNRLHITQRSMRPTLR